MVSLLNRFFSRCMVKCRMCCVVFLFLFFLMMLLSWNCGCVSVEVRRLRLWWCIVVNVLI